MVKTKVKSVFLGDAPRDLEMLEVVARYYGLQQERDLVSLVRHEFFGAPSSAA